MITHEIPYIFCVNNRWNCQNRPILTILKSRLKIPENYGAGLTEWTNQNEDAKFVLPFTKPTNRELRNEISDFLLTDVRMARP